MGLFGALGKLGSAVIDTALSPVDVAVDAFTIGDGKSRTVKRAKKIVDELEEAYEETFEEDD